MERILPLEGVHNFRDYGGYATAGGGRVRSRVLWRSAQHGDATDNDLAAIAGLGLATVIDLRGTSEREAKPCRRPNGFAAEVLTHDGETTGMGLHLEAAEGAVSPQRAREAMQRLYEGIAYRENLRAMLQRYFQALDAGKGPSLVHCVAGKDRTGFAVALLQHVLGVHRHDIAADFLLTNVAGNIERRIAAGAEAIRGRYGAIEDETIRILMGVEPQWIEAAFAAIAERDGTVEAYLDRHLGVDSAMAQRLRDRFIAA